MWEPGNHQWGEARTSTAPMASSCHTMMHEIHVLLVDHDSEALIHTAKMLEICQYRVTLVELASAAISMLMSGKARFDVVMANINSPDLHSFKLLQQSVGMGIPIVLMSNEENTYMAMRALESGAFLCLKKPASMDVLRCLWQHVLREKTRMIREREMEREIGLRNNAMNPQHRSQENPNNNVGSVAMMKNKGKMKSRAEGDDEFEEAEYQSRRYMMKNNNNVRRKMCTEWTQELHAKFMRAVEELGEGRCFPKEILELMDVPGLTRMQVASHLQKCRNDNWRSPLERKSQTIHPAPLDPVQRARRFGSKPQLGKNDQSADQGSETQSEPNNMTHLHMGNGSTSMANTSYHRHYGQIGAGPSSAPRHSADRREFFNFRNADCLTQNAPGLQQGSRLNQPNPAPTIYHHFGSSYHDQNSGGGSVDSRSPWSSDTSDFESEQSESRCLD